MAYTSDRTGADIDQVLDNADVGNIGKSTGLPTLTDANDLNIFGMGQINSAAANMPSWASGSNFPIINATCFSDRGLQLLCNGIDNKIGFRTQYSAGYQPWQEIYHTGSTSIDVGSFSTTGATSGLSLSSGGIHRNSRNVTTNTNHFGFYNPNGQVGSISTSGTATSYNTSSDPRLKDFKDAPSDEAINDKFNSLFDAFAVFNWKSDPEGDLVWGFDAHKAIDNGLDMGFEGEGSRDLALGEVYDTIPAKYEDRAVIDDDGNETDETETVEVKPEQELKVSPAGVDQSKAVPILLAKLEQLERRIKELES